LGDRVGCLGRVRAPGSIGSRIRPATSVRKHTLIALLNRAGATAGHNIQRCGQGQAFVA
jgi:hypothetical protein